MKKFQSNQELLEAIVCNDKELTGEDLLAIKNLLPSSEERDKFNLFRGKIADLSLAEKFMFDMLKEPNLEWIIEVLIFERFFDADTDGLTSKLAESRMFLEKLKSNEELKILLGIVLELGNMANYEYGRSHSFRSKAKAFKLDSLGKLQDFKGKDGKTSLLNYLATVAEKNNASILLLPSQFSDLSKLRFTSHNGLMEEFHRILTDYDILNRVPANKGQESSKIGIFLKDIADFRSSCKEKVQLLKEEQHKLETCLEEALLYFGEEPKSKLPEELFSTFDAFFRSFGKMT